MKNVILKNTLPDLPKNYRWKFGPYTDEYDALDLQKKLYFWWETVRTCDVPVRGGDVVAVAKEMVDKQFGPHTDNTFYGTSK